ncbi:hypothetical protein PHYPSEUDO_000299 [Phytophthora pseudosyringae]|uniref:Elicitin n=1 Tax=Phytophthora pseudosyringae TaxID=221518 RepID=A0A8T1V5U6_9STRA|nr:hypothetical protein PHYPSEUDO_000299 [Phytophthora pseudosyringae]
MANANDCTDTQLQTIASSSHLAGCVDSVGFSILSSLTTTQIEEICASTACMKLWEDIEAMGFGDCTIPDLEISLQAQVLDPVSAACGGSQSDSISSSSSSGNQADSSSSETVSTCTSTVSTAIIVLVLATILQ